MIGRCPFRRNLSGRTRWDGGVCLFNSSTPSNSHNRGRLRRRRRLAFQFVLLSAIAILASGCAFAPLLGGAEAPGAFPRLDSFRIVDPYAVPGRWYKVQLHIHSAASIDSQWPIFDILETYAERGYDFIAITDHDVVTKIVDSPPELLVIPAEESTISVPFYPVGPHAVFLFVDEKVDAANLDDRFDAVASRGGLISLAHPNWPGNFGHGRWDLPTVLAAPDATLMEIVNPHSNSAKDEQLWHELTALQGPNRPVWAVAVDDAHNPSAADKAWSMVKADAKTLDAVREALRRGSHYPTTGLNAEFFVNGDTIYTKTDRTALIEFVNGRNEIVYRTVGTAAEYRPRGDEGFVRIVLTESANRPGRGREADNRAESVARVGTGAPAGAGTGAPAEAPAGPDAAAGAEAESAAEVGAGTRRAWSQPFWLLPDPAS